MKGTDVGRPFYYREYHDPEVSESISEDGSDEPRKPASPIAKVRYEFSVPLLILSLLKYVGNLPIQDHRAHPWQALRCDHQHPAEQALQGVPYWGPRALNSSCKI